MLTPHNSLPKGFIAQNQVWKNTYLGMGNNLVFLLNLGKGRLKVFVKELI